MTTNNIHIYIGDIYHEIHNKIHVNESVNKRIYISLKFIILFLVILALWIMSNSENTFWRKNTNIYLENTSNLTHVFYDNLKKKKFTKFSC